MSLEERAGIYLSDVAGHLLSLKIDPVRVTCISCSESCYRSQIKTNKDFETAAKAFTEKHGYLDRKIADSINEIVEKFLGLIDEGSTHKTL